MSDRSPRTTEAALGLYRMYIDCADSELEEIGCTREDILLLARQFDTDVGRAEAAIAISAKFGFFGACRKTS